MRRAADKCAMSLPQCNKSHLKPSLTRWYNQLGLAPISSRMRLVTTPRLRGHHHEQGGGAEAANGQYLLDRLKSHSHVREMARGEIYHGVCRCIITFIPIPSHVAIPGELHNDHLTTTKSAKTTHSDVPYRLQQCIFHQSSCRSSWSQSQRSWAPSSDGVEPTSTSSECMCSSSPSLRLSLQPSFTPAMARLTSNSSTRCLSACQQ